MIASKLLAHLLAEAAAEPGLEVCGLLFGDPDRIGGARACANAAADPTRFFEIDPAALFAAHRAQREGGPRMIGHYHSHPTGRAEPSSRDAALAAGDGALWLILGGGSARAWRSVGGSRFVEQALCLVD